jgi:hypothetical protein
LFSLKLAFGGECRDCEDGIPLLEDDNNVVSNRRLDSFDVQQGPLLPVRSLQASLDTGCICEKFTIADRAPTYTEFKEYLEQVLLLDPVIGDEFCSILSIEEAVEEEEATAPPTSCISDDSCTGGLDVCTDADQLCTEPNSCLGDEACRESSNLQVASNSCVGEDSCKLSQDLSVGSDSCTGTYIEINFLLKE